MCVLGEACCLFLAFVWCVSGVCVRGCVCYVRVCRFVYVCVGCICVLCVCVWCVFVVCVVCMLV